jgi:lysozyme
MNISEKGLAIIKECEGYEKALPDGRCAAYQSYLGNGKYDIPTLGWGCTAGVSMGMIWTRDEAEAALRKEMAGFESGVTKLLTFEPTQNQFDALVSFSYNVGLGNLAKSSVLRRANAGDFPGAAAAFMMWNKAQGVELAGLTRRRHEEATLFLSASPAKMGVDVPDESPGSPIAIASAAASQQSVSSLVDSTLAHVEAHRDLLSSSWTYWTSHMSIKGLVGVSAGTVAFSKDYALVVAGAALLAIVGFEVLRYVQRNQLIKRGA